MRNIIRNAIVYTLELPSAEHMAEHMQPFLYEPLGETFTNRASFVPCHATGELVTPVGDGYAICVRYDEKILPKSALNMKVNAAIREKEAELVRTLDNNECNEIRDVIFAEMVKVAFVKSSIATAFYHVPSQRLVVATSSKSMAHVVTHMLVRAVGSIKVQSIFFSGIKHGLATRLRSALLNEDERAFGQFDVGDYCKLSGDKGRKVTYQMGALTDAAHEGLVEALSSGCQVESMELVMNGACSFKVTKDFHFRGIDFFQDLEIEDDIDTAEMWRLESGAQLVLFASVVDEMSKLVSYEETETSDPS